MDGWCPFIMTGTEKSNAGITSEGTPYRPSKEKGSQDNFWSRALVGSQAPARLA